MTVREDASGSCSKDVIYERRIIFKIDNKRNASLIMKEENP